MPMFREDNMRSGDAETSDSPHRGSAPIPIQTPPGNPGWLSRRLSEESIRTELCEGPVLESPPRPRTPKHPVCQAVSDRAELIERLKRGESPTWIPNRHLTDEQLESLLHQDEVSSPPRTPEPAALASSGLLPPVTITPEKQAAVQCQDPIDSPLQAGLNIVRPPSALHSGNFTPVELSPSARVSAGDDDAAADSGSPFHSAHHGWMNASPPSDYTLFNFTQSGASYRREAFKSGPSSLSCSLSSSFVYKPPTSPLVQSESNDELDLTLPLNRFNIDTNSPCHPRRHTLNFSHSPFSQSASHRQSSLRREGTYPYQAHQPRRSLNSTPGLSFAATSPQTPAFLRPRRPSIGSEASPLQHASMVGSYEESILRGRMSTTPSKPLEFTAQIGVLGLGKCKATLRCPAHVTLPFSAVFYNYSSTSSAGAKMEDGPSPYVGQVDLENGLPNSEEDQRLRRKLQIRYQDFHGPVQEAAPTLDNPPEGSERSSRLPKAPPGGAYRIPEKGQLQIIIKNQNKTAVKLFLVPYDLGGMEPGTKTFIRQRSYSTGPIIEAEVPAAKEATMGPDRPTLRYLIHLHICCPYKGRYYLYKSIRVVFANRVPDGKERLRNEVTCPEPRFTPYKPIRVMHPPPGPSSSASQHNIIPPNPAAIAAESATRRRSIGFSFSPGHHHQRHPPRPPHPPLALSAAMTPTTMMPGVEMTGSSTIPIPTALNNNTNITTTTTIHPNPPVETYDKLSKGDAGYGGGNVSFSSDKDANGGTGSPTTQSTVVAVAEGLLSKRLRSLDVQQPQPQPQQ
ncbi:hypothetical protein N658DRAFT_514405 [Parathielavia hyrcaniae]|uniref:Atos-like conserved domain-containing protein n=1 Tax=Parathielavia hyrcaniae TaxID=113614 RepID=A0AAN6Q4T1_9PEZI|nr:hypothetical protein N658DRAFT_514405 [Parathielavia hyrcaniae]